MIIQRFKQLIEKFISVKGCMVLFISIAYYKNPTIDFIYPFIAWLLFVGAREAIKIITLIRGGKVNEDPSNKDV